MSRKPKSNAVKDAEEAISDILEALEKETGDRVISVTVDAGNLSVDIVVYTPPKEPT
jgi:hypothetical protein